MSSEIVALIIFLVFSAFFSASETAITSFSHHKISGLLKKKQKGARTLKYFKDNPGVMFATILLGNNLVNVAFSVLATQLCINILDKYKMIDNVFYVTLITTFITTSIVLVFGEVIPKTLAMVKAQKHAPLFAQIVRFLSFLLAPFVWILNRISTLCIKILGGHPLGKGSLVTEEEILSVIEAGKDSGAIQKEEETMLQDVIKFSDKFAGQVMTPLSKIMAVEEHATFKNILMLVHGRLYSRIPIFRRDKQNIFGVLYLKDLLMQMQTLSEQQKDRCRIKDYPNLVRLPYYVYNDQKIADILKQMKSNKVHIAVVRDHSNKAIGLISMEDLIEEIFGEIADEYEA